MSGHTSNGSFTSAQGASWSKYLQDAPPPAFPRRSDLSVAPTPGALLRRKIALPKKRTKVSVETLIQTAWSLVNVYYSDAEDVVFGLAVMNETEETEVDASVTAVPFRFCMRPDQSIAACLGDVDAHDLPLVCSQSLTLGDIAKLGSDMRNATKFDNQLVICGDAMSSGSVQLDRAINIECTLTRTGVMAQAFYDATIIDRTEMQRVLGTFDNVLKQLCEPSNMIKTLADITPISEEDLSQVKAWNMDVPEAAEDCMHHLVQRQVEQNPAGEAICAMDISISYKELDEMANKLAHYLMAKGVKPGSIVPFMSEKSPLVIPVLLAIIRSGGAFVPFDPAHQWDDTAGLLEACEANLVFCSPNHQKRFQEHNVDAIVFDMAFFDGLPSLGPVSSTVQPKDPGYVIFTSGSTGKPKGIVCSHSAWCTNTLAHGPREFCDAETRHLQFAAYTFDISITDIFTTLAFGGTVCVPSDHEKMNDLPNAVNRMSVNHAAMTPTVAQFLRPEIVPTLKTLITGGEAMPAEFISMWSDKIHLINSYGPAETTSRVSCSLKKLGDKGSVIGTNMGAALWVTHSNDPEKLLPIGAIGELLVDGNVLADGYLKNEAKTQEAFIAAPQWLKEAFPDRSHRKLYRTGDLVQQQADGSYAFIGRRDTQIKIHGVRLEAGHIEAKIKQELPDNAELVVDKILVGQDRPKQMLAAFITLPDLTVSGPSHGTELLAPDAAVCDVVSKLHKTLLTQLPSYMVPNYILPLKAIPLGTTGKVNRRGLQSFARGLSIDALNQYNGGSASGAGEKPRGETEVALSKLWAEILQVSLTSINRHDSFFALGGDSVQSMKLVSEAATIDLHFSVADVFQFSTLTDLAQFLDGPSANHQPVIVEEIDAFELIGGVNKFRSLREQLSKAHKVPVNRVEDIYPCLPMQEGMMAETIGSPEAYILQEVLKLSRNVDLRKLEASLEAIVEAYPIMRTRIVPLKQLGTCQVVMTDDEPVEIDFDVDLSSFLARDKKNHMGYADNLSRFAIIQEPTGERFLVWTAHHAITDGHMHQDILRRLELTYNDEDLPETLQFNQVVKLHAEKQPADANLFWADQFTKWDGTHYPECDETYEPSVTDYVNRRVSLPKEASGFTPSIMLRAAWALVLAQLSNQNDVVMGITQSGRDIPLPGVHECLGPCLATVPLRVLVDMEQSVTKFLHQLQSQYVDIIQYQHAGLQHIRKASKESAAAVGFHNLLVVQPATQNTSKLFLPDEARNSGDQLNFGLLLECILANGEVSIRAGFDSKLLSVAEADLLVKRLEHVFHQLSSKASANMPIKQLSIVSPADMQTLQSFNPEIEPLEQCMHWMIEEQARRRPNALMIDSWDGQLTYGEANEYSDRLAGVLIGLGVGPESLVPFAFEKSAWAIIAVHAIMKAGGACVALDMAHPRARHEKIVADTEARVIVASTKHARNIDLVPHVIAVDQRALDQLPPRPAHARVQISPKNPAWVVYSSGSTGTPKGSILEHRSLCSTSRTNSEILGVGPSTRAIHFASYSFDVAIEESSIIPMYGGCICIPSEEERLNDLPGAMRRMRVNWADLTPTVGRMLNPENVPCLERLVLGGESLTKDIIDTWGGRPGFGLFNTYGPSECSIQCTSSKPLSGEATGANIGFAVNCKLWVVDPETLRLLPVGSVGELLIEGSIVGRGYLKEATKTEAAFISDLIWAPGRRFYRTGDLCRFNPDGSLDCLGRSDSQVKLYGQRIELGEIEYNIKKHLSNPDAAQIAVEAFSPSGSSGRKLLAAFIQFAAATTSEMKIMEMSETLRNELSEIKSKTSGSIPEYMVPSLFVPMISLPMNTSGKIDRKKLRGEAADFNQQQLATYSLSEAADSSSKVALSSEVEQVLAGLWADVLHIDLSQDPVGANDSFLERSGDSITAMQLVGKARAAGLALSVPAIMKSPCLADMALAAKRIDGTRLKVPNIVSVAPAVKPVVSAPAPSIEVVAPVESTAVINKPVASSTPFQSISLKAKSSETLRMLCENYQFQRETIEDVYPTTPLQEGLVALTATDGSSYVLRDVYELPATINIAKFKAAWNAVARKDSILRTRVVFIEGIGSCQVVVDEDLQWQSANDLDTYLEKDRSESMGYGTPLARYAIVDNERTKKFVWTVHHALYDGFSMGLTFASVDHAYNNNLTVPRSRPFRDFIEYLQNIEKDTSDLFWEDQLKELETAPFPQAPTGHRCQADNTVTHAIPFAVERKAGFTIATMLKAAWSIAVSRLSDSGDVVFGVTQFGRDLDLDEIDTMNGPTITTVPVRVKVDPQSTVKGFLSNVQNQGIDMIPFSHAGLQNIKKISDATRASCEFQNLLVIQPGEEEEESALFRKHETATTANYLSSFGLVVECALNVGEVVFSAHHDSAVISATQVGRLLRQFEHLLNQLQVQTGKINDVDMFSSADRADISAWNSNYPKVINKTMSDIITQQAAATPFEPAIASRAVNLTYKEMDELSNHLAHQLQALGVGPEKIVPICLERSPEAILSMIAIQKAGGAFVPLNPNDPTDRLLDLIDQVEASVVIFSEQTRHLSTVLASSKISPVVLPQKISSWGPLRSSPVVSAANASNLAYALFTSGSTGRPKAVMIHHQSVTSSTYGHGVAMGFADYPRRTLQFATYTFDACIAEIFTALHFGGCICIPTEHERMNDLPKFIRDFRCDWAFFTPSFVRLLKPEDIPCLKTVVLGGEALNQECVDIWGDSVHLMNGYGPTETCVFTVTRTVPGPRSAEKAMPAATIGHPVSSIGWVVDPNNYNVLTPVGCPGELLIQGPNVARGYLKNPEKTAESFVSNPKWLRAFGHMKSELLYRTGDLVRQDVETGMLTYLGRIDGQVKINGQRLELGEIETRLKTQGTSVESTVVLAGKTKADKKQTLAAFVEFTDAPGKSQSIMMNMNDSMRSRMKGLENSMLATMPKYMVPSLWIPVNYMPILAASGKTDRKTLTTLFKNMDYDQVAMYSLESAEELTEVREASTDMEKTILELVARTLGRDLSTIHANDSFLRVGGDSISAISLVSSARSMGITLSTEQIFRQPRICDMAVNAVQDSPNQSSQPVQTIAPYSLIPEEKKAALLAQIENEYGLEQSAIADLLPPTPLQEGLVALTIKDKEAYVLREIYRLPSKLDINRFKAAWEAVVRDAEVLRTRIVNLGENGCFQVVMHQTIEWHSAKRVQEYIDFDKEQPFGYGVPLARFALIETEYTGCYFVWSIHHALYDGWSKGLITKQVEEAYRGSSLQPTPTSTPPFNRFISFLQGTDTAETQAYWKAQFTGIEAQSYPRLPSASFDPILDKTLTIGVPLSRKSGSSFTTGTILKAAWGLVLGRYTGAGDALFGCIQAGRNVPIDGISDMIGPTITTVPLRIKLDGESTVTKFLQAVQDQSTDMIRYEHSGLQNIAKMSNECREACAFTNIMVIQPGNQPESDFVGAQRIEDQDKGFLRFGMGLECTLRSDSIEVTGGYDQRLVAEAQMRRLLHQLKAAIHQLNEEPEEIVSNIDIVSSEDMAEMAEMNANMPDDIHECTHDIIHRTALQRSDAMAVNAWDVDFKYFELDQLSTKLANHLRNLGVGPETIVPLCFEKSGWAIVAVLGVMKAGAAFVFLDPAYPMARLDEIVSQVDAKVVLSSLDQAPLWRVSSVRVLVVDNVSIESLPSVAYRPDTGVTPESALYVIFTSGSTGKPKGCVIEHHSFLTCARAQAARSQMTASSRVLQGASYSFDVSVMEMLTALTVGACVCVPNERIKKRSVIDVINDFRITWAFLTPSVVKFIKPTDIPHLKTLILGGEALTTQNIQTWAGHVNLINGYGPTECTIAATANSITNPNEDPANIGTALGGICWITDADDHNKLAPLGTIGELIIEGNIVARGYLNNPEKTIEVFIENPTWAQSPSGKTRRFYKSGDLAYFNTDGSIMFMGRKDTQVKVRGQRMELGEIETHLTLNKNIQHAMVMYPKTGPCKRQLVGIVSIAKLGATTNSNAAVELISSDLTANASNELGDISKKLSALVPSYMVPQVWIALHSFPLLISGKLNRKRVEQWLGTMDQATHQRICGIGETIRVQAPSNQVEQQIHQVWVEVLKLPAEEIGVTQDFATLGGDSILGMQVVAKLRSQGYQCTMTDVANARTITQLASRIARGGNAVAVPAAKVEETTNELFDLTPIQQFYANFTLKGDYLSKQTNKRFNHTFCLGVKEPISSSVVNKALEALVNRHAMLRARFQKDKAAACGWKQYVSTDVANSYRFTSWDGVGIEQVKPVIEQNRQGLDLEKGPIMAVDLVSNEDEQHFYIVAHHLVVDLVSWNTILRDLEDYIRSGTFVSEKPYPFSAWAKQQSDYAVKNFSPEKALPNRVPKADFKYWGMEDRINIIRDANHHTITLSERDTAALLTTCQKAYGAEPMDILCSALSHSFNYVFRDRAAPTIFRYNHGREQIGNADPSGTVGWFTTLSPLHVAVHSRDDSVSVLKRTVEARKKIPMNGLGYFASRYYHPAGATAFAGQLENMEVSINYLGVSDNQQRSNSASIFDMNNSIENGLGADGQEVKGFSLFSLNAEVQGGRLNIHCAWNKNMRGQDAIQQWFKTYERALKDVAYRAKKGQPTRRLSKQGNSSSSNTHLRPVQPSRRTRSRRIGSLDHRITVPRLV
ncbi:non-ribosomal peptide synthetase protein [Seiridium cupressi]